MRHFRYGLLGLLFLLGPTVGHAADALRDLTALVLQTRTPQAARALAPVGVERAAEQREALLLQLAATAPGQVAAYAIAPEVRSQLPNNVRAFVETWETVIGRATFLPYAVGAGGPLGRYTVLPEVGTAPLTAYVATRLLLPPTGVPTRLCGILIQQTTLVVTPCKEPAMQARLATAPSTNTPIVITATNTAGGQVGTATVSYVTLAQAAVLPGMPQALATQPRLSWVPVIPAEPVTYVVERALVVTGPFEPVAQLAETTYLDLTAPALACYRIRAVFQTGESSPPTEALCVTHAGAPTTTQDQTATFTRLKDTPVYAVAVPPYTCTRRVGGTSQLIVTQTALGGAATVLKTVNLNNPAIGSTFTIRCQVTTTAVNFYLDGALRVTVAIPQAAAIAR